MLKKKKKGCLINIGYREKQVNGIRYVCAYVCVCVYVCACVFERETQIQMYIRVVR